MQVPTADEYASQAAFHALCTLTRDLPPAVRVETLRALRTKLREAYAADGAPPPAWLR